MKKKLLNKFYNLFWLGWGYEAYMKLIEKIHILCADMENVKNAKYETKLKRIDLELLIFFLLFMSQG